MLTEVSLKKGQAGTCEVLALLLQVILDPEASQMRRAMNKVYQVVQKVQNRSNDSRTKKHIRK